MNKSSYRRALILLFLASVFLLSLCKIKDADTWIHLSMGRLIWNLKGLPDTEPFVYTMYGKPFSYSSWLFGLIYYIAYHAFNIYGVILLKAVTVTTAFYILVRDSLRPYKNHIVVIVIMTAVVIISRYRFVERPDTFLMVFLSFSIFSLNAFVYDNRKYIYALPFVHMLWANSHSSINLMGVPFLSFIIGGYIQQYLGKRGIKFSNTPSMSQLKIIFLIFIASFGASLISPYFLSQYTFGAQFLTQEWYTRTIVELRPPAWETNKASYIIPPIVITSFLLNWFTAFRSKIAKTDKHYSSLIHLLMVIPFIFLSFRAQRFEFIVAVVAGPILARNISELLEGLREAFQTRFSTVIVAFWIILYTALTIAVVRPFGDKGMESGFGISHDQVPEGALKYMDKKDIKGRIFNTFHFGQYIVWRDFPKRAPFIDGRGYISPDLLEKRDKAKYNVGVFDELYKIYGFESVLVEYPVIDVNIPETMQGVDLAFQNPQWALVYWDDLSLLYLKRGGIYQSVINEDEYRFVMPTSAINRSRFNDRDYASGLIRELKRNIEESGSSKGYAFLGFVYNERGLYREAIESFSKVRDLQFPLQNHLFDAYKETAYAYSQLGYLDESISYCRKALSINEDASMFYNMGIIYFKKGDKKSAARYLKKALDINKNLTDAYPLLIDIYRELGWEADAHKLAQVYDSKIRPSNDRHDR